MHDGVVVSPRSPEKTHRVAGPIELDRSGAENVSGAPNRMVPPPASVAFQIKRNGVKMLEGHPRILLGVERQCRLVFGKPMTVGKFGILFLQIAGVGQKDCAKIGGRMRTENWTAETHA